MIKLLLHIYQMKVIKLIFGFGMMLKCFLVIDFDGNILEDFEISESKC